MLFFVGGNLPKVARPVKLFLKSIDSIKKLFHSFFVKRAKTYSLGGIDFTSLTTISKHAGAILRAGKGRVRDPKIISFLSDLLNMHENKDKKIGCGVDYFYIAKAIDFPGSCFHVMRTDGYYTDFGINACLCDRQDGNSKAFRKVVQYQVDAYKSKFNGGNYFTSEFSGEKINIYEMSCDHIIPFRFILAKFVDMKGLSLKQIKYSTSNDNENAVDFIDKQLLAEWRAFHSKFPLRVVSANENLSAIAKSDNKLGKDYWMSEVEKILIDGE